MLEKARASPITRVALGALAVVGVFLAFRLALFWRFPPFFDEVLYANWTVEGFENPAERFIALRNAKEPLLTWAGMVLMYVGAGPLTAVRLTSLLSGLVTLVMCGLIGRELGGLRVGLTAAALAAVTPFFVVHDVIGIMDPLATAFVATALFLQIRLARTPGLAGALLLGLVLGGGLLTKSTTDGAILLIPAGLLVFDWSPAGRGRRLARWAGCIAVAVALAYAVYSLMKLSADWDTYARDRGLVGVAAGQPVHSIGEGLSAPLRWLEGNWPPYRTVLLGYVTLPVLLAAAVGVGLALRRRLWLAGLLALWFLAPLAMVLLLVEAAYPRYLLVAIPPLLVLAAYGIVAVVEWIAALGWPRLRRVVALAVAAAVLVPALVFDGRVLANPGSAHYPGLDDEQYVRSGAALAPYEQVADDLRRLAGDEAMTVALGDFTSNYLQLEFRDDRHVGFLRGDAGDVTCSSLYAVETSLPLPDRPEGLTWRKVKVYPRPRDGTPTVLYESAAVDDGRVAGTPDELRGLIGGTDADFDRFVAKRPCVRAWLEAWYGLHAPA